LFSDELTTTRGHPPRVVAIGAYAYKTARSVEEDGLHTRLLDGDGSALSEIYDRFGELVFGLALRTTRDRTLAEDVTQETFVALWQAPAKFDPTRGSLRSWLCTIAHRRSIDAIRRNESHKRRVEMAASEIVVDITSDAPEQRVVEAIQKDELRRAVDMLPDDQRLAVCLAYFEGLTFRQVAETLHIPEGTAKSRIRLATKQLAESLRRLDEKQLEGELDRGRR
jgi:RNA polymerase sigma factor (sigma-70 family)